MDNFEWELSKENITKLDGGRSVHLLNKVLTENNLNETHYKRKTIRHYIRWFEQVYPTKTRSTDLESLLYRCVHDSRCLPDIHNNVEFVSAWVKLTRFCDRPAELFELLFRQGIGTLCTNFYIAWADCLQGTSSLRQSAAILAHALRCRAQPLAWLEDRVEQFLHQCRSTASSSQPSGRASSRSTSSVDQRRQLASLTLISDEGRGEIDRPTIPIGRTTSNWHADQKGLQMLSNASVSTITQRSRQDNATNSTVVPLIDSQPDLIQLLHTLPDLTPEEGEHNQVLTRPNVTALNPSTWHKENRPAAGKWTSQQLSMPTSSQPSDRRPPPQWGILVDSTSNLGETDEKEDCVSTSRNPPPPSQGGGGRRGLRTTSSSSSAGHFDLTALLANQPAADDHQSSVTRHQQPEDNFSFPIQSIYIGTGLDMDDNEISWEMQRGVNWFQLHKSSSTGLDQSSIDHHHDHNNNSSWFDNEQSVMRRIDQIVSGSQPGSTDHQPQGDQCWGTCSTSNRASLIHLLESLAINGELPPSNDS